MPFSPAQFRIACVPAAAPTFARLKAIAPPQCGVVPCRDEVELVTAISRGDVGLTVVVAGGPMHPLAMLALRRVHDAFPQHPLVAWVDVRQIEPSQLIDVAGAGVKDLMRTGLDDHPATFAQIVAAATQRAVTAVIADRLRDAIPRSIEPVFLYALERANEHLTRSSVAAVFGVSQRTLHARLERCGMPSANKFLTWCRLLVASALLEQPGHTLDSVAGQLDFSDGSLLGRTIYRYAGHGVSELRRRGALDAVVSAFRAAIAHAEGSDGSSSLPAPTAAD